MWGFVSGAFSKSSVHKVCECLKAGCVWDRLYFCSGWGSGSPFLNTTNAMWACGTCLHLCLPLCGGGRTSARVFVRASVYLHSRVSGCLCECPQPCASLCVCLWVHTSLCKHLPHTLCARISAHTYVFNASVRAGTTACAYLCPRACRCVRLLRVGAQRVPVCEFRLPGPAASLEQTHCPLALRWIQSPCPEAHSPELREPQGLSPASSPPFSPPL